MADPTKKSGSKSTAKGTSKSPVKTPTKIVEKAPEKPATNNEKKRATTTKSVKVPVEPAKAKTAPQVAPAAAEPVKPTKPAKVITARATKAAEETSPLVHRPKISAQERHDLIAQTAYFLFTQRGGHHGRHLDDWIAAEALITARLS